MTLLLRQKILTMTLSNNGLGMTYLTILQFSQKCISPFHIAYHTYIYIYTYTTIGSKKSNLNMSRTESYGRTYQRCIQGEGREKTLSDS